MPLHVRSLPMVLKIGSPIFEAKGLLFNRATRVWKGIAVNDNYPLWTKGKTYILKQNCPAQRRILP